MPERIVQDVTRVTYRLTPEEVRHAICDFLENLPRPAVVDFISSEVTLTEAGGACVVTNHGGPPRVEELEPPRVG